MLCAYENKTKCLKVTGNKPNLKQDLNVDGHLCEKVRTFKYLSTLITRKNYISA
jgi:hypothetical protein